MKYSLVKKLIKKDIKNIFLALSNDDYDLSETGGNIINIIEHARLLFCTFDSEISYNYKINDLMVNLWTDVENDTDLVPLLNTYGKNKILACVLLYNRAKNKTLSMLNNSKISYVCDELLADINVIDNINEISYTDISDGCTLTNNTIYINTNGNIIYNVPGGISYFSFYIIGALPTEIVTNTNDSGIVGTAVSAGFKIKIEGNKIIGEAVNGGNITTNCGSLLQLKLDDIPDFIDFIEFKDTNTNLITVTYYKNTSKSQAISTNAYNFSFKYKIDSQGYIKKTSWNNYYDTSLENRVFIQTSNSYIETDTNSENYNKLILRKPGSLIWDLPNYYTDSNSSNYDDTRKYNLFVNSDTNLVGTINYESNSLNEEFLFNESNYNNVQYGGNNDDSNNLFFNTITDTNDDLYNNKKRIKIIKNTSLTTSNIGQSYKLKFNNLNPYINVILIKIDSNEHIFEAVDDLNPPINGKVSISQDIAIFEYNLNNGVTINNNNEFWIKSTLQQDFIDACKSSWVNTVLKNM